MAARPMSGSLMVRAWPPSGVASAAIGCALALVLSGPALAQARVGAPLEAAAAQGQYVFRIAGCTGCHTREGAALLSGGPGLATPFGTFYGPNITPSPEQGIGRWTSSDLSGALGRGVSPDGGHYYPVFPYTSYTRMNGDDVNALFEFLRTVPADQTPSREHDIPWFMGFRIVNWFWKLLFFDQGPFRPDPARTSGWNRGAYLAQGLAHCGECHTPRNIFGAMKSNLYLAGNPHGPEDGVVPNITSHKKNGVGLWSPADLVSYLTSGALPDGDYAGGAMAEVIYGGLEHLRPADADAVAEYIGSIPPNPYVP